MIDGRSSTLDVVHQRESRACSASLSLRGAQLLPLIDSLDSWTLSTHHHEPQ